MNPTLNILAGVAIVAAIFLLFAAYQTLKYIIWYLTKRTHT